MSDISVQTFLHFLHLPNEQRRFLVKSVESVEICGQNIQTDYSFTVRRSLQITCNSKRFISTKPKTQHNLNTFNYRNLSVPFPSPREADVAYQVLRVDSEPKRSGVVKILTVKENRLEVKFTGTEARKVRVGLTSFFESLLLVLETIKEFGPPVAEYMHYY